jgi:hypothetical protein
VPATTIPHRNARGERRDQGRARSSITYRLTWEDVAGTWTDRSSLSSSLANRIGERVRQNTSPTPGTLVSLAEFLGDII